MNTHWMAALSARINIGYTLFVVIISFQLNQWVQSCWIWTHFQHSIYEWKKNDETKNQIKMIRLGIDSQWNNLMIMFKLIIFFGFSGW